jgi:serine/threonine protein kinase
VALPCLFGRYRLEKLLGKGGMGVVYQAEDTQLGRTVALKIPFLKGAGAGTVRARFLSEARSAALLSHPNICPVFDLGEVDGVPYLTMAYVHGKPLSRLVGLGSPLEPAQAANLVRKIALALAEAHARGVIHRDLKPGNVLIDGKGEPIIMDFGLARRADSALGLTQQGDVMGTPAYMSPEQINGETSRIGPASDQYSLGVMLYELLTGHIPYLGDLLALVSLVNEGNLIPPSRRRASLHPRFDAICLTAMAVRPESRYPSVTDLATALIPLCGDAAPVVPALTAPLPGAGLTLRVPGTPFAYRPLPGQKVISLGRQKRRPGEPSDVGNDVVLRIPNNDALSARISRRHLEIAEQPGGWVVIDRGRAGTLLNGKPLPAGTPCPLTGGDRLVIAGVLTLEVDLAGATGAVGTRGEIEAPAAEGGARVVLEATMGDMITVA